MIEQLRHDNDKANYIYRIAMLVIYGLVLFLYLTPLPTYLSGNHPKSHMTLYLNHHSIIGTEEDLTYLPAFPIYLVVTSFLVYVMYLAAYECATRANLIKLKGLPYPAQPHPFGSAPNWIVPVLRDIRVQPSSSVRADPTKQSTSIERAKTLPPQLVYIGFLWVCSWPVPLITFGVGAFDDAAWWAFSFVALSIHLVVEWWIYKAELDTFGLSGLKHNYKGA